jgi:hypothetical protein
MFYSNPVEFEKLSKYAIPAFSVVSDTWDVLDASWNLITGGEDILQTGPNAGQSRTWRNVKKVLPLTSQYEKMRSAGKMIYRK